MRAEHSEQPTEHAISRGSVPSPSAPIRWLFAVAVLFAAHGPARAGEDAPAAKPETRAEPAKQLFRGRVVLLREALRARDIESAAEMAGQVALENPDGELVPLVADWRGRAFFQDERLRNRKVELIGLRRPGVPYLQVLTIYTFDEKGTRQYTDYWCDICSIPMYEIKPCDCCQGEIRLRFQPQELPADLVPPAEAP